MTDVIAHECPSVNSDFTIALYKAALEKHPEAESIYIITDNARYYLSKKLREWAGGTKIKQIFLPPYSPNLNLIERLSGSFFGRQSSTRSSIGQNMNFETWCLNSLTTSCLIGRRRESLLTLNFRVINSQSIFLLTIQGKWEAVIRQEGGGRKIGPLRINKCTDV